MTIEPKIIDGILILAAIGAGGYAAITWYSADAARRLAARLYGRAMYLEMMRAESKRATEFAEDLRRRELEKFGLAEMPEVGGARADNAS